MTLLTPGDGLEPPDSLHDVRELVSISGGSNNSITMTNVIMDDCHVVDVEIKDSFGTIKCRECSYLWAGEWA